MQPAELWENKLVKQYTYYEKYIKQYLQCIPWYKMPLILVQSDLWQYDMIQVMMSDNMEKA